MGYESLSCRLPCGFSVIELRGPLFGRKLPVRFGAGEKDAAFVRSHFDGMEVRVGDAPRAGEIVVAVALAAGGRPLPRIGGLAKGDIKGEDGLR